MADVKWIKITTDIFSDEKILLIEQMPDADSLLVIWFKLLCMAGKENNYGVFLMRNRMPYTEEMLATIFRRPLNTVRLALATFEAFGMIEIEDDIICIPNWEKHQNIDGMEKIREQTRRRVAKHREKQRQALLSDGNVTVTLCNATDKNREDKNRLEENNDISASDEPKKKPKPVKHKHGEYNNVLLTDEELVKLQTEFPIDWSERIDRLSGYIESTGKKYKSHLATIRNWAKKDKETPKTVKNNRFNNFEQRSYDMQAFERMMLEAQTKPQMVDDDPVLKAEAEARRKTLRETY